MGVLASRQRFFEKLDGGLRGMGFKQVDSPYLAQRNESIYNRGTDGRSNFFVFVKRSSLGVFVKYFDPDAGKPLDLCMKRHLYSGLGPRAEEKAERIAGSIGAASSNKPDDAYSLVLHGHWKSVGGRRFYGDDGASDDRLIIRDMMYHHADFDFTGHHNIVDLDIHERIKEAEAPAGIGRAVSAEVTLRMFPENSNGPHLMIWSDKPQTMLGLERDFLQRNDYRMIFPSLATYMDPGLFLQWLRRESGAGNVAVGIAHPFAQVPLPFHPVAYGLFSSIGKRFAASRVRCTTDGPLLEREDGRFSMKLALALAKVFGNGIAAYNGAISERPYPMDDETARLVGRLKERYGIKGDSANIRGFLVSNHLRDKYGLFPYYEPDFHSSPWSGSILFYLARTVYSRLSHGVTWFLSAGRPEVGDIIRAMHERKGMFRTKVRWERSADGTLSLDDSADGLFYKVQSVYWAAATNLNYLREFLWESYRRVRDIVK